MSRKSIAWTCAVCCVFVLGSLAAVVVACSTPSYDLLADDDKTRAEGPPAWTTGWRARLGEVVLPLLEPQDTVYAPAFKEEAFARVNLGATEQEVLGSLGEPLLKKSFPESIMRKSCPSGCTVWYYSRHGSQSKSYLIRAIEFDYEGLVARKFRHFYVD